MIIFKVAPELSKPLYELIRSKGVISDYAVNDKYLGLTDGNRLYGFNQINDSYVAYPFKAELLEELRILPLRPFFVYLRDAGLR